MRRAEGRSIKEIARLLRVSTSSVSHWVRDIELTDAQHAALQARNGLHERQRLAHAAMAAKARARRSRAQQEGRRRARTLNHRYICGCMLYWAEGSRTRNKIVFTNSDPEMARFFAEFMFEFFDIENFWLATLRLPRSCLCKSTVNRYSRYSQKKRKNKLPYGTCRIVVHSTEVAQTIYGLIQELAGFDRPEWLDMPT